MGGQYSSRAGPYCQGFLLKPHVAFTMYRLSLFHSLSHVLGEDLLTDPGYNAHYGGNFSQLIKYAKEKAPLNLVLMTPADGGEAGG